MFRFLWTKAAAARARFPVKKMTLTQISSAKCFEGYQKVYEHESSELKCKMRFGIYLPPKTQHVNCPALYWLSGLTCTEQNFITKAASQQAAAEHGIVIVAPDTSPRGCNIQGEDESWDFGTGAGFYLNATEDPWKMNYRMHAYITEESVSALAPICNPVLCPWGQKAFTGYLGSDKSKWETYDATCLARTYSGPPLDILIDQGKDDQFLAAGQLLPENFIAACTHKKIPVVFRLQEGYDHSYYFIATFVGDHIKHHAKYLNA
ncbi:S-formylglutathione hydrolase isoform X2 [Carcharodon carcharias]|uniref:S-formylglutathione hydrolase isoform X2 n=1 Tax=Carcharodon carcharias TaxID=13397 RepID=UPI001B7F0EDD|nr:S-formylglutathione hydrolase isoform X2 [Carcharodon carcharias]